MSTSAFTMTTVLPRLARRERDTHKGDFGRVLVVAGSSGMMGAACLTAQAALRSGAGLVTLAVPRSLQDVAATKLTSIMTLGLAETPARSFSARGLEELRTAANAFDCVAAGPGLGRHPETLLFAQQLPTVLEGPLVLDADALFALAEKPENILREAPTVITPHPGEMARLVGLRVRELQANRLEYAVTFAQRYSCVTVLKGAGTAVTDGRRVYVNTTGNPGMATAGSGDVLTGMIAGLLPQMKDAFSAAVLAVFAHGLAGDRARDRLGEVGMTADDILAEVPLALWSQVEGSPGGHEAPGNRRAPSPASGGPPTVGGRSPRPRRSPRRTKRSGASPG
jgi:NAD(P)H-hydrate epimerase